MPNIELKKIGDLIPYFNNPRNNDAAVDKVAESIKQFGFQNPIIVDRENVVIAGHTRLKAAEALGLDEIPVIVAKSLTNEQARAYRLADNKTGEFSEWDIEKLNAEIAELNDFDLSAFGFDIDEFNIENHAENDDFDVSEALDEIEEPTTKQGDLYKLGNHYLLCGDSTNESDVKRLMQGAKADLFLTDPPYNVNYGARGQQYEELGGYKCGMEDRTILNDNMADADFKAFLQNAFNCADSVMKAGATFYIWHSDSEGFNFRGACHDIGWQVRQCLIWAKNTIVLGRQDYQWKHEPCLYGWKDGAAHNWYSDRTQTTVLNFDKPSKNDLHPTMKPLDLIGYLVQNSSKQNDVVLDLFGGSGSTLIACEQLNRRCFMTELDPKYCDVIIKRWETLTGKKAEIVKN